MKKELYVNPQMHIYSIEITALLPTSKTEKQKIDFDPEEDEDQEYAE